jgi:hypothetical protein
MAKEVELAGADLDRAFKEAAAAKAGIEKAQARELSAPRSN